MFTVNEDLSIYATRGDTVFFTVTAEENGVPYYFEAGDVLRIKIFQKKNANNVVLEKCFPVEAKTDRFTILLTEEDTKIGEVISKATDYWYEIELNPFTNPQTIIGYDEDGAKIFRLFPEGKDSEENETKPEDIPVVDLELDLSSNRPVENRAIARAIVNIADAVNLSKNEMTANLSVLTDDIIAERVRIDNIIANNNSTDGNSELVDLRVDANGVKHESAGATLRNLHKRLEPVVCFLGGHFDYDTETKILRYVVDNESFQFTSVFEGESTRNKPFVPTVTEFDIAQSPGVVMHLVVNVNDGSLRTVAYNKFERSAFDYILLSFVQYKIYPVGLSPLDLYENGVAKYVNVRNKGFLHSAGAPVVVDLVNETVTIPVTNFYKYNDYTGFVILSEPEEEQIVSVDVVSKVLSFVCYNVTSKTAYVVDRKYQFDSDEFCILGVCSGKVIPVELNPACVKYVQKIDNTKLITINDMVSPMFNAEDTFKIVLGGDSITHGVGGKGFAQDGDVVLATESRTWNYNTSGYCWAKLFKEYVESNYNASVMNNGLTGSYSAVWKDNKETLIPADTDLFVFTIGTNDRNVRTGITTKEEALTAFYNNVTEVVKYCHSVGVNIILASPIPASASNEADKLCHIYELNGVLQKIAAENNIEYANLYNDVYFNMMDRGESFDDYLTDGLHPNDAGYKLLFYRYMKLLNIAPSYIEAN